jgi:hypothetical protein
MFSSKQLALMMLLFAASFVAVAAAISADGTPVADIGFGGMKLLHLIIGTAAAGVSLWFLPQFETKSLGATITCGMIASVLFTPAALWGFSAYFSTEQKIVSLPGPVENVLAAVFGIGGVYIIPGIAWAWKEVRNNPWGFLAWIRGGARTPPPNDKGGQP